MSHRGGGWIYFGDMLGEDRQPARSVKRAWFKAKPLETQVRTPETLEEFFGSSENKNACLLVFLVSSWCL